MKRKRKNIIIIVASIAIILLVAYMTIISTSIGINGIWSYKYFECSYDYIKMENGKVYLYFRASGAFGAPEVVYNGKEIGTYKKVGFNVYKIECNVNHRPPSSAFSTAIMRVGLFSSNLSYPNANQEWGNMDSKLYRGKGGSWANRFDALIN